MARKGRGHLATENFLATACSTLNTQPGQAQQTACSESWIACREVSCPDPGYRGVIPPIQDNPDQHADCLGLAPGTKNHSDSGFK